MKCTIDDLNTPFWDRKGQKDPIALPTPMHRFFRHALDFVQHGEQHDAAKVLKGFGGVGVLEVSKMLIAPIRRYTVCFQVAVFVLHVFQKKSKRGIETPQADMAIIRQRLKIAAALAQELKDEKAHR